MTDFQKRFAALVRDGKLVSEARTQALREQGIIPDPPRCLAVIGRNGRATCRRPAGHSGAHAAHE